VEVVEGVEGDGGYGGGLVGEWTNAAFLVRDDTGMLLTGADLDGASGIGRRHVAAVEGSAELVVYDAERGVYAKDTRLALTGVRTVRRADGREVMCSPGFERLAAIAAEYRACEGRADHGRVRGQDRRRRPAAR